MHSSLFSLGARRYAGALYGLAAQYSLTAEIAEYMKSLAALLQDSADFRAFIASPLYNAGAQMRFIRAFCKTAGLAGKSAAKSAPEPGTAVGRFLAVLAQHKRLNLLPQIIAAYLARAALERGDVVLDVVTAQALSKAQEKSLVAALEKCAAANAELGKYLSGKNRILHKRVEPALLGGFIVRCGSLLIDTSLRSQLSSLKLALKEVG